MQKLLEKLKNTPRNASQVPCSVNSSLNKDQSLSVKSKVLSNNNHDGNLPQRKEGKNLRVSFMVYVLAFLGEPLVSCSSRNANLVEKIINSGTLLWRQQFISALKDRVSLLKIG